MRRRERRFDKLCFRARPEHENAVRQQVADKRHHDQVTNEQKPADRQQDGYTQSALEQFPAGQVLGNSVSQEGADNER